MITALWKMLFLVESSETSLSPRLPVPSVWRFSAAAAAAESLQSYPILCNPKDGSPPGSPIPGILQARTLKWVAIAFSNVWRWKVKLKSLSRVRLLATPWTAAYQVPCPRDFPGKRTGVGWRFSRLHQQGQCPSAPSLLLLPCSLS